MTSHWDAFMDTFKLFTKDYPSVFFHGLLTKLDESLEDWSRSAFPGSNVAPYLISGVSYTLRQDYFAALTGTGGNIPGEPLMLFGGGPSIGSRNY